MNRPYVICHMQTSIDGRISGKFFFTPAAEAVYESDNEIRKSYKADAILNGAVTCAEIYADGFLPTSPKAREAMTREDYLAEPHLNHYIVCVDTKGTLKWNGNSVSHRGGPPAHVIEVLTEDVDDGYLSYLRELDISYIFAGAEELDIPLALKKLKTLFGIERILLTGGGQMNWTFLQADCLDELNIVILPMVDGNTKSAGIFDRPASGAFAPAGFQLAQVEKLPGDGLWLKYIPDTKN
ncbi:MAG: RibD family protein [Clostridiales bacterium]|nr:RibD family protein [Clostridiales bacterium]